MKKIIIKKLLFIKKKFSWQINFFFLSKHIIMENLTTYELRFIAEKRGIKDYKKISIEELLRTFNESVHFIGNLSQNGQEWMAKIQNLSQNGIKQIMKTQSLSRDELEQIAKKGY